MGRDNAHGGVEMGMGTHGWMPRVASASHSAKGGDGHARVDGRMSGNGAEAGMDTHLRTRHVRRNT